MDVEIVVKRGVGQIVLGRSEKLGALSLEMLLEIEKALERFRSDAAVRCVYIYSNCEKSFSAGADIRWVYENGRQQSAKSCELFLTEYRINEMIYHYTKPFISLIHGITMGGGAGLSMHANVVVATETLRFAMPEVKIGYFPDAGSTHFLTKLPKHVGLYLALTGDTIAASDAYHVGLIENLISHERRAELVEYLPGRVDEGIEALKIDAGPLMLDLEEIEKVFSQPSLEAIQKAAGENFLPNVSLYVLEKAYEIYHFAQKVSFNALMEEERKWVKQFLEREELYQRMGELFSREK